jgi:hypothetical protein
MAMIRMCIAICAMAPRCGAQKWGDSLYYKEPSIISGTGAAIWSKLTFGLLATITLEIVSFHAYALFPVLLLFLKCMLEVVISEGVQYCLQLCLEHLKCVKMAAFQLSSPGVTERSRLGGGQHSCCFW